MKRLQSLLKLKPYLRPFIGFLILSAALAIPLAALRLSPAPLVKYLVDDLLISRDDSKLYIFPFIVVGVFLLNFVIRFFHYYLLQIVIIRVNQKVKARLFDHLLGLSADYFTDQSTGTIISRVGSDPQHMNGAIAAFNVVIREPLVFLGLIAYALHLNWKLTLITLVIFPFLAWVFSATGRNLKRYMQKMTEENARLYSTLQETFSGFSVVKLFGLESFVQKKFDNQIDNYAKINLKSAAVEEASHPMVELLTAFALAAVIFYGGGQVLADNMTSGDLLAFFATFALMMDPVRRLNEINIRLNHAAAATDRIFEIFSWKSRLSEAIAPREPGEFQKSLQFDQVSFSYPHASERTILKDVSFEVRKSQTLAIVGESGSGKSSLVSLLPRIYDVTHGSIKMDGIDIREFSLEKLRQVFSVVSQDVFLFNDTVLANIQCGNAHAEQSQLIEAAKRAHAHDFILTLPEGYQTIIGDRGQKLSGGERQRLSIARAFLRKAPILILDEATSNLDTASEQIVQAALVELMENKTSIVIAHRLSTIQKADHIIVLKEGEIVESGSHDELLKKDGQYSLFQQLSQV
jgi:ATP-binding cassette, subfamily B, bacterial MsbA